MLESVVIQNLFVAAIVLTAGCLLVIRASKYFRGTKSSGCGAGCGSCPSKETTATPPVKLLQLGSSNRRSS